MFNWDVIEKVKDIVFSCLKDRGFELVDVKYHGRNRPVLTILIDRLDGGITVEECALMNNLISEALDAAAVFDGGYLLEVSSPGVDRPLKGKSDFSRAMDKRVRCFLCEPVDGRLEIEGTVRAVNEDAVTLETAAGGVDIAYAKINKSIRAID